MSKPLRGRGSALNMHTFYVERYVLDETGGLDRMVLDTLSPSFQGTRRPLGLQTSSLVPEGERIRKEWKVLTTTKVAIDPADTLRDNAGVRYQVITLNPYRGYTKLHLRET